MIAYAWWRREVGLCIKVKPQWQHYVQELHPNFNFMKNPQLAGFHRTLNGEMKRLCSVGLGAKRRQAEPIPVSEENVPRKKGLLGCTTPRVLVDTMVFLCGLYFALGSSQEHRSLTFDQLELFKPYNGRTLRMLPRITLAAWFNARFSQSKSYRIAGNFRWVQIFAIFADRPASAKIKTAKKCTKMEIVTSLRAYVDTN